MKPMPVRSCLMVWVALLVLLAASCASAFLPLGWINSALNLAIAVVKALLVALFFMHLRRGSALVRIVAATALFTLAILAALTGSDYGTRAISHAPYGNEERQ